VRRFHGREAAFRQHDVIIEKRHEIGRHVTKAEVPLPRETGQLAADADVLEPPGESRQIVTPPDALLRVAVGARVDDEQARRSSRLLADRIETPLDAARAAVRADDNRDAAPWLTGRGLTRVYRDAGRQTADEVRRRHEV